MDRVPGLGRAFFALALIAFGIQQFKYRGVLAGLELLPEHIPAHTLFAYVLGAILCCPGIALLLNKQTRRTALLVGVVFFFCLLLRRGPGVAAILHNLSERTVVFETLALCGAALSLASVAEPGMAAAKLPNWGPYLFGVSMIIFGIDHFQAAVFVANLVPAWIPWHLFWVYVSALGFIAAGISFALGRLTHYSGIILGWMFFLWVAFLHTPRVAANPHSADEWNSAFVALAMSGAALILSSLPARQSKTINQEAVLLARPI